jgi:hypothetical protein
MHYEWSNGEDVTSHGSVALLQVGSNVLTFRGQWIPGGPWERFGLYNSYVVIRVDGSVLKVPAHAGELVPGSTEDLVASLAQLGGGEEAPRAPMTMELDPTYRCASLDCGGRCFSARYRSQAPGASIPTALLEEALIHFAEEGGRIVRFDGGGDPLLHPAVRSGYLPALADLLGLKSTILTSGDLLDRTEIERLGAARCYLRISFNAASDRVRQEFHGNAIPIRGIFSAVERLAAWMERSGIRTPIGATFLLDVSNFHEVAACAHLCRDAGISHFSVRRVLGPPNLRPAFSEHQEQAIQQLLAEVASLAGPSFRVFCPWRRLNEPDLSPASGELQASRCWQSTLKVIVEPTLDSSSFRAQLCGRYRGGGIGQRMRLPELFTSSDGSHWLDQWRRSFREYEPGRAHLPSLCVSCIDRGFIELIERLVGFLGPNPRGFSVLHLASPEAQKVEVWGASE